MIAAIGHPGPSPERGRSMGCGRFKPQFTERDRAVRGNLEGRARPRQLPSEWVVDGAQRGDGDRQERLGRLEAICTTGVFTVALYAVDIVEPG